MQQETPKMKTVLFIMLPYPSHYMPCFGYANRWKEKGWNVVFTGWPSQQQLIEKAGFEYCEIGYTTEYKITTFKVFVGLLMRAILDKKDIRLRFRLWYDTVLACRSVVAFYKPEKIFIDDHLSYYFLYLSDYQINMSIINTKLSTQKSVGVPPLNSTYIPQDSYWSQIWSEVLWRKHLLRRRWHDLVNRWAFAGKDEGYFQERYAKKRQLSHKIDTQNALYDGIRGIEKIILAPKQLEFSQRKPLANEVYIDPKIVRDEADLMTDEYLAVARKVKYLKQTHGHKIIYAAFGTLTSYTPEPILTFVSKLVAAVAINPDWFLVLSLGGLVIDLPKNVNIATLAFVPQLDALTWADAMVMHGGLGSVKEALQAQVPMLVYPFHGNSDMTGNAARIQQKGWGLRGSMRTDSSYQIAQKLSKTLTIKYYFNTSSISEPIDTFIFPTDLAKST
jgi:zeaxanthin glucosyltransferase